MSIVEAAIAVNAGLGDLQLAGLLRIINTNRAAQRQFFIDPLNNLPVAPGAKILELGQLPI